MRKYVLILLTIISIGWIGYVALNIVSGKTPYSPASVFIQPGEDILVIHKGPERDFSAPEFHVLQHHNLYQRFLSFQERIQHFYFSGNRDLAILERSKPWTTELVRNYFTQIGIPAKFVSARTFELSEGLSARFDSHFLVVYRDLPNLSETPFIDWDYADKKSDATVITWKKKKPTLVNCYFEPDGMIKFLSESGSKSGKLINDAEVFADIVPGDIQSYTFYEKGYLQSIAADFSLAELSQSGFVVLCRQNETCVVFDLPPGLDPIASLGDNIDENSINSDHTEAQITVSLPSPLQLSGKLFLRVFNNRVFLSETRFAIDWCIGAYEAGQTVLQDHPKYAQLFAQSPAKVSYRQVKSGLKRTLSLLDKSVYGTLIGTVTTLPEAPRNETPSTTHIEGGIAAIYPIQTSKASFIVTKTGKLWLIGPDGNTRNIETGGEIIGRPLLTESGLLVTSVEKVHLITNSGNEAPGYPVQLNSFAKTAASQYTWRGKTGIIVGTVDGIEQIIPGDAKRNITRFKADFTKIAPVVWVSNNRLLCGVTTDKEIVTVDLQSRKIAARTQSENSLLIKWDKQPVAVKKSGQKTALTTINQQLIREYPGVLVDRNPQAGDYFPAIRNSGTVIVTNGSGEQLFHSKTSMNSIDWISGPVKSLYAVLDGIANKIYIYRENGNLYTPELMSGSSVAELQLDQSNTLWLLTVSNDFVVRYQIK